MSHRFVDPFAFRVARVFGIGLFCVFVAASIASGQLSSRSTIEVLDAKSLKKLEKQRELVATLARRHVGSTPSGRSLDDLRILQELFDRYPPRAQRLDVFSENTASDKERIYEIQALGVVLGDVMAHHFDLEWVVVEDEFGRGRALNVKGTTDLVFPVTMISKRYEVSLPVDVRAMYDEIEATLSMSAEEPRRQTLPVRPATLDE